jgi:hypothetical protein
LIEIEKESLHTMQRFTTTKTLTVFFSCAFLLLSSTSISALPDDKMSPKDLIAKHLEAIGTSQARSAITSRVAMGTTKVTFRSGGVTYGEGRVVLASDGVKNLVGMVFNSSEYPHEKVGFDGKEVSIGYIKPGIRSSLGRFVEGNKQIFSQGLFAGALSSSWPLLDPEVRQAKLEFGGTKKVEGKEAYVLRYYPQKGSDVKMTLFFDKENFRHIRSEYYQTIAQRQGGASGGLIGSTGDSRGAGSAGQLESRYTLTEDFSDFKTESGLTLPHSYKIQLWIENAQGSVRNIWEVTLSQFGFNQKFDEGAFDVNKPNG